MIQLKSVTKTFPQGNQIIHALDNINLTIKDQEFLTITGKSGSGKSTLLNLISGLDQPTSGQVIFNNRNLQNLNEQQLSEFYNSQIGFIFQDYYLIEDLNLFENLLLPLNFNHRKRFTEQQLQQTIQTVLTEVNLDLPLNAKAQQLSGGQKQRLAIARALINSPTTIIADEPTGSLDDETAKQIIQLLKKIHTDHNITLIISTHDNHIKRLSDRNIEISKGKIQTK